MISEGSCDTEVWSNDADNTAILYSNVISLNYYFTVKKNVLSDPKLLNSNVWFLSGEEEKVSGRIGPTSNYSNTVVEL